MIGPLFHCFGNVADHAVDTPLAVAMLHASGCRYLAVNTHGIEGIPSADRLPVGYATATLGSVLAEFPPDWLTPVLNINLPVSAAEAVDRTRCAVDLIACRIIKLEVLEPGHRLSDAAEVLRAAEELAGRGDLRFWPLIPPDFEVFRRLEDLGCPLIRVMGSPIGSLRGILPEWAKVIRQILEARRSCVMLDGGIGTVDHAVQAIQAGCDAVLVNSCLFEKPHDPAGRLRAFHAAVSTALETRRQPA